MSLAICPVCRQKISVQAPKCPHCGQPFGNTPRNNTINWIVGIFTASLILFMASYALIIKPIKEKEKAEQRERDIEKAFKDEMKARAIRNIAKDQIRRLERVQDQILKQLDD